MAVRINELRLLGPRGAYKRHARVYLMIPDQNSKLGVELSQPLFTTILYHIDISSLLLHMKLRNLT